jgi:hypothetical protein
MSIHFNSVVSPTPHPNRMEIYVYDDAPWGEDEDEDDPPYPGAPLIDQHNLAEDTEFGQNILESAAAGYNKQAVKIDCCLDNATLDKRHKRVLRDSLLGNTEGDTRYYCLASYLEVNFVRNNKFCNVWIWSWILNFGEDINEEVATFIAAELIYYLDHKID